MESLINRRRVLGRDVPEYSEVEYIESVEESTSFVINGFIPTDYDNEVQLTFEYLGLKPGATAYCSLAFSSYTAESANCYRINRDNNNNTGAYVGFGSKATNGNFIGFILGTKYSITMSDGKLIINGTELNISTSRGSANTNELYLMGPHCLGRMYSFKWFKAGELVLDLVPVRKGNVGYMYDRISGNLYGEGSKLIPGPDVISKPYDAEVEWLEKHTFIQKPIFIDYIPTGTGNSMQLGIMPLEYIDNRDSCGLIGTEWTGSADTFELRRISTSNNIQIKFGDKYNSVAATIAMPLNERFDISISQDDKKCIVNGTEYNLNLSTAIPNNSKNLVIPVSGYFNFRIYYLKWFKNGELVVDLIPVRKGNKGLLYDKVSDVLYEGEDWEFIFSQDI